MLPVTLPPLDDFRPRVLDPDDAASEPELPLGRVEWWATIELDLGDGPRRYQRELNVMPQWAGSCWYELRYLDPTNEDALRRSRGRALLDGPPAAGGLRRRRPVRRRRRARGAAPALRPLLAQGAVRPRLRVVERAVPPPLQPGLHPGRGLQGRARDLRRRDRGRGARRRHLPVRGPTRHPRVGEDGQEPEERGRPGRHLRRVRRGHAAAVRDVDGTLRHLAALEHPGHRRHVPVPATPVAQPGRRGDRCASRSRTSAADDDTRRLLHRTIDARVDGLRAPPLQHRDRQADRAEQPPDAPGRPRLGGPPGGGRAAGPDDGAAHPSSSPRSCGRGSGTRRRWPTNRSPRPTPHCWWRTSWSTRCR